MTDRKPVEDWATDFDIFDDAYTRDPAPVWQELHAKCPIAHTGRGGGMWMATRYDDVQALVRMTSELSNRQVSIAPLPPHIDPLADYHSELTPPISADPPEHVQLRRLILPLFTPRRWRRTGSSRKTSVTS